MKLIYLALSLLLSAQVHAEGSRLTPTKNVRLVSLNLTQAVFNVSVCPADAPVEVDIAFVPTSSEEFAKMRLEVLTPEQQCYANTSREISVDLGQLIPAKIRERKVKAPFVIMESLPFRFELQNIQ